MTAQKDLSRNLNDILKYTVVHVVAESSNDFSNSLVNRGYKEVITYSFISNEMHELVDPNSAKILLKNPISDDMAVMRSSLWSGLIKSAKSNIRRGHHNARFFELGQGFTGTLVEDQVQKIAGIICGNRHDSQWAESEREVDFFDAKSDVEALLFHSKNVYTFEAAEHPALQLGQAPARILAWPSGPATASRCGLLRSFNSSETSMIGFYGRFRQNNDTEHDRCPVSLFISFSSASLTLLTGCRFGLFNSATGELINT